MEYVESGQAHTTVKRIRQLEVVVERPVYIEMLPIWLRMLLIFIYDNICFVFLIVLILVSTLLYALLMAKVDKKSEEKSKGRGKESEQPRMPGK